MNQSRNSHRNIDGFFRQPPATPQARRRPGLDNVGSRGETAVPHRGQQWQPRRERPAPPRPTANDYFHVPAAATPSDAGAGSPTIPVPLRGGPSSHGEAPWWKRWLHRPSRRTVKRTGWVVLAIALIIGGYMLVKFMIAASQVFQGNIFNAIFAQGKELKTDEHGRSNILLFGTSEDDPNHPGAELTDSMMLVSIDQETKKAFMVSIPRDLYIDYGMACAAGYEGKINNVYVCAKENNGGSEKAGQRVLREKVGEVFGVDVQYSVHVNYTALKKVVNAVGGITVTIESDDPRGILDRNFDWQCNYECYLVKHENGPVKLDGLHALALARARGATAPTYGLSGGNFDREMYQRKILLALKEKAVSAGTLANPVKVNGLIEALGNNVRTNFQAAEIKTLVDLAQEIKPNKIRSLSLVEPEDPLVTTGSVGGMSIVQPSAGLFEYGEIHAAIDAYATGNTAYFENAAVDVLNAGDRVGAAGDKARELNEEGIVVEIVGNAPESLDTAPVQLYDLSGGEKPDTLKRLETVLGVQAIKGAPEGVTSASDFVIIVGSNGVS